MSDYEVRERLVRVETLMEGTREDIAEGFAHIERKLSELNKRMAEAEDAIKTVKIGARTLWILGSVVMTASATFGAFIAKWLPFIGGLPK